MATVLTNESSRGLGLPGWRDVKPSTLMPGIPVEVPDEYVTHLRAEVPGVAGFFALERGGIRVASSTVVPVVEAVVEAAPMVMRTSIETLPPADDASDLDASDLDEPDDEAFHGAEPIDPPKTKSKRKH